MACYLHRALLPAGRTQQNGLNTQFVDMLVREG